MGAKDQPFVGSSSEGIALAGQDPEATSDLASGQFALKDDVLRGG